MDLAKRERPLHPPSCYPSERNIAAASRCLAIRYIAQAASTEFFRRIAQRLLPSRHCFADTVRVPGTMRTRPFSPSGTGSSDTGFTSVAIRPRNSQRRREAIQHQHRQPHRSSAQHDTCHPQQIKPYHHAQYVEVPSPGRGYWRLIALPPYLVANLCQRQIGANPDHLAHRCWSGR